MKSWLRSRKTDSASTHASHASQPPLPPISIKHAPPPPPHHEWDALAESAAASVKDNGTAVRHSEPARLQTPAHKQTTQQLIETTAAHIVPVPLTHQQHILVRSEHYFRLALESWEQLRACHFKASQKFSLAEWMHIHALLLYGRIQAVRKSFSTDAVAQHNRIDLSLDVAVFDPLATLLNTIGVVQDKETGITYIPDALFPAESHSSLMAYTASEMQSILDGTMYDWQRSWKRVLEARHQRDTKYTQFSLVRSSSELIYAIREKSELIARIQQAPEQKKRDSFILSDFKYELNQLQELLEEARNAKDYTIRPPCVRVYDRAEDTFGERASSTPDLHSADRPLGTPRTLDSRVLDPSSSSAPNSPQINFDSTTNAAEPASGTDSTHLSNNAFDLSPEEAVEPVEVVAEPKSELPESMKLPMLSLTSGSEETKATAPLRSALRKGSATLLQDLRDRAASPTGLPGSVDVSLADITNSSDITLRSNSSPTMERDAAQFSPSKQTANGSPPKRNHRVQIAGTADASDCFVHFDARIWEEYQAFVDALKSTNLTKFGSLKKEREGSYAWMLPVRFNDARQPHDSIQSSRLTGQPPQQQPPQQQQQPALRSTPLMVTPLHKQSLLIRLPRTSIPRSELALALLLQTSSTTPEINDSWHVETKAELDMRQYVLDYVNTGIFDTRAM